METENLLEKISNNFETDPPKMNEEFTLKQNRLYEILESFALIPKNEVKKSEVQENLRNFDIMMNEKKDFNENKENQSQEKKSDPKLDIKVKSKKTKDDIEFEDNSEYLKYLEKYLMYQEEFCIFNFLLLLF